MRLRRLTVLAGALAAVTLVLWLVGPAQAGRTWDSYVQQRCVVRAGILVPNVAARLNPPDSSLATPSPYALWLLGAESAYVPLEPFTDANGNGRWDPGEAYTDSNGNGRFDSFDFYPPRPPGWEIINPIAAPGIDNRYVDYTNFSGYSAYWTVDLSAVDLPLLENFDLLLLPITDDFATWVGGNFAAASRALGVLERWVDEGGVLWIDNQRDAQTALNPDPFFLRPPLQFGARDTSVAAVKEAVDPNHPLLSGRCVLSGDEVQLLGRQYPYNQAGSNTRLYATRPGGPAASTTLGLGAVDRIIGGVNTPDNLIASITTPQEVVGEMYDSAKHRAPVIAAGRYGDGTLVITACAVAAGISDWYADLTAVPPVAQTNAELPQWALPDMKLAYNITQWGMDWSGAHGRARQRGDYAEAMPGPPLITWIDRQALAGSLAGPACVDRGLAFAGSSAGILGAWDAKPQRDRDLGDTPALLGVVGGASYVKSDDGATDYAAGSSQDLLWQVTVPWQDPNDANPRSPEPARQVVGSPAVNMAYVSDPVNPGLRARPVVAVAVKTEDNLDCSLQAYLADGTDAARMVANPAPLWSATLRRHDRSQPQDNNGLVSCGPVAIDEFFALLTTDSGTLEAPNRDAHLNIYNASGPGSVVDTYYEEPAIHLEMSRGGRAASFANSPAAAMTEARDVVRNEVVPVQAAVLTGNSLPRPGPSAVGWLYATPLMLRAPAPGWDQTWLTNSAAPDVADDRSTGGDDNNQSVMVLFRNVFGNPEVYSDERAGWIQVPPHVNNDPRLPLNYVRSVVGGQIVITFTRWSMFAWGPYSDKHNKYPCGFREMWIRYRDTQGSPRDLTNLVLSPAAPVALNGILSGAGTRTNSVSGFVNEQGHASPCVFRDSMYVGADAVNAYPSASSEGQLASYTLGQAGSLGLNWRFIGDRYRAQDPATATGYYFSSFSVTPAYAGDTLYAASNYSFFRRASDGVMASLTPGPAGALYALEVKASPELINPATASPVFPSAIDPLAPRNDGRPIAAAPLGAVRAQATGIVTITTEQPHNLLSGYTVRVSGVTCANGSDLNGDSLITVTGPTTFTYSLAGPDDAGGGGVVYYQVFPPFSADPNQTVAPGRRGAAVWISTSLTDNSPRYSIPAVSASQGNWRVDYRNRIIRLEAGAFGDLACPVWSQAAGRYLRQRVRVRYFSGGAVQEQVMEVAPLVKWMYLAPDGWEFVSSPVAANGMVMVVAYDHAGQRYLLLGFRAVPQDSTFGALPLWSWSSAPEYVQVLATGAPTGAPCSLAVAENGLVWSADVGGLGGLVGLASGEAIIADNDRLLAADAGGGALTTQNTTWRMRADTTVGSAGIPMKDSYAERVLQPLQRPARVRSLPTGSLLVADSGASAVMELSSGFDAAGRNDCGVVWRYPNADTLADLGAWRTQPADTSDAVPAAQLLAPSDAQRFYYQQSVTVPAGGWNDPEGVMRDGETVRLEWLTTLIADTGKKRVLEVARPLLNGRYRPDVTDAATGNPLYVELAREVAGSALTDWPTAPGGVSRLQAAFTTADRLAAANAPYQFLSSVILCGVSNHPADPFGRDGYVRLVGIAPYTAGEALAVARVNRVVPRTGEGINFFRPRISPWTQPDAEQAPRDFLGIRQADLTVVPGAGPGEVVYHALIVDDVGVKVLDNNWNSTLTPVFEMRGPAPWLHDAAQKLPGDHLTTYEEEIAGGAIVGTTAQPLLTRATNQVVLGLGQALQRWVTDFGDPLTTASYPPLIVEPLSAGLPGLTPAQLTDLAYRREALRRRAWLNVGSYASAAAAAGQAGAAPFLPSYAKQTRTGSYLIVNSYPEPLGSAGPLDAMAPAASEVLQVSPAQPVGLRIVQSWDTALGTLRRYLSWERFMVPDPARSEYPGMRGGAASFAVPKPNPQSPDDYTVIPGGAAPLRQPRAVDLQ